MCVDIFFSPSLSLLIGKIAHVSWKPRLALELFSQGHLVPPFARNFDSVYLSARHLYHWCLLSSDYGFKISKFHIQNLPLFCVPDNFYVFFLNYLKELISKINFKIKNNIYRTIQWYFYFFLILNKLLVNYIHVIAWL